MNSHYPLPPPHTSSFPHIPLRLPLATLLPAPKTCKPHQTAAAPQPLAISEGAGGRSWCHWLSAPVEGLGCHRKTPGWCRAWYSPALAALGRDCISMGGCWLQLPALCSLSQLHPDGAHTRTQCPSPRQRAWTDPVTSPPPHPCTKPLRWPGRSQPVPPPAVACAVLVQGELSPRAQPPPQPPLQPCPSLRAQQGNKTIHPPQASNP